MNHKNYKIRELRDLTGLTQQQFASTYEIPLSTLRKWEQGESSPPAYVVTMLARMIPGTDHSLKSVQSKTGSVFYYDSMRKMVYDRKGNAICISEDPTLVKKENLPLYLEDLFSRFYEIQERFNRDCRYDMEEDIIWS